jgi:methionine-S-sulfoxide reductase
MNKEIYLAGGCFWGVQAYMNRIKGVIETEVGYANGETENPSYYDIKKTGHAETVKVIFDDEIISLKKLLDLFFKVIDPTISNRQGHDIGTQYRTGIYFTDNSDKQVIESFIKEKQKEYKNKIVTEVCELDGFYTAEEYHQDYLKKNPKGYCHIDLNSMPEEIE